MSAASWLQPAMFAALVAVERRNIRRVLGPPRSPLEDKP